MFALCHFVWTDRTTFGSMMILEKITAIDNTYILSLMVLHSSFNCYRQTDRQ